MRQVQVAERRARVLVRSLSAFYLSVGSFAAARLSSLLGALCFLLGLNVLHCVALAGALLSGMTGVGGLVTGGAVAFTDDGSPVVSAEIMRRALEYCRLFDKAVLTLGTRIEEPAAFVGRLNDLLVSLSADPAPAPEASAPDPADYPEP